MADILEILGKAKLPESSVTLCLAADLQGRWEELDEQLGAASAEVLSLGEVSPARKIALQMNELRAQMEASQETFRLRALSAKAWRKILDQQPEEGTTDELKASYDDRFHAWVCKVVAVSCYDPGMSIEQADELSQYVSGGQWKQLTDAAWELNGGRRNVPFSSAASALTRSYEQNSKRQEPGESPTADGSASSRAKKPATSTTSKDA